jgi:hypothetical protein
MPLAVVLSLWAVAGPVTARAESRIAAVPVGAETRPAATARLRFEVIVPKVLTLEAASATGAQVSTNGGTFVTSCPRGCSSRGVGTAGSNQWTGTDPAVTVAQP